MSLNWNAKNVEGWDEIDPGRRESVIFATMAADMGEITEENHEEFYRRTVAFAMAINEKPWVSLDDVKACIGLKTNVFTTTQAEHRKRVARIFQDKVRDWIYAEKQGYHKPKPKSEEEVSNG
jgi:hypothetical protein